jgi:hypothetical protein
MPSPDLQGMNLGVENSIGDNFLYHQHAAISIVDFSTPKSQDGGRQPSMTQVLLPNMMAFSTSYQPDAAAIELPRYRARKSDASQHDAKTLLTTDVQRHDSFDSTLSGDDKPTYCSSSDLQPTQSLLDKPVVRKLVFRRHWFHSDMTVYSAHPTRTAPSPVPVQGEASDIGADAEETTLRFENAIKTPAFTQTPAPEIQVSRQNHIPQTAAETETPIYHLATSEINPYRPDITMYAGPSPSPTHVLATAHFRWSRNARLAFGADALDTNAITSASANLTWEELKNTSSWLLHHTYEFSISDPSSSASTSDGRRHFRLTRTRAASNGVEGWTGYLSNRNYLLIDLEAHETVGVFLADNLRSLTRKGELRLFRALGKEVEVAVVLAVGVVSEKATRRERKRHNSGGGGG